MVELTWDSNGLLTDVRPDRPDSPLPRSQGPVICGMPNLHSHAFQRALVGRVQQTRGGDDFWSWRETMYQAVAGLTPESLQAVSAWLFSQLVASGYTSVVEFHYVHRPGGAKPEESASAILRAARETGIRLTLAPVLYRWGGIGGIPLSKRQGPFHLEHAEYRRLVEHIRRESPDTAVAVAPHSVRASDARDLRFLSDLAESSMPIHIHVSEQPAEVQSSLEQYGKTPIEWLESEVGLDHRWALVHATHATRAELDLIAQAGATVVLCPTTEHDLGDGRFPLESASQLSWGLGSDSHVSVSPAEELRLILYGMRAESGKRAALPDAPLSNGTSLWQKAASAKSAVFGRPVGVLDVGATADFLVLDGQAPIMAGLSADESVSAFVLSGTAQDLAEVRVGGRVLARHGRHVRHDELLLSWKRATTAVFG
ncbi:MAG: formimidoylglutamate deiminase [Rhodothermales bacterium]|jgi:formimidoylglutamate deiminase